MSTNNKSTDFAESKENEGPTEVTFVSGARFEVFNIKKHPGSTSTWSRMGSAFVNADGSINVYLDVLPLDGKLHIRKPVIRSSETTGPKNTESSN